MNYRTAILLSLVLAAPVPGIVLGAYAANSYGISVNAFASSVLGVCLGIPMALYIGKCVSEQHRRYEFLLSIFVLIFMAISLIFPGVDNVHRWIPLGSLRMNITAVLGPTLLWSISRAGRSSCLLATIIAICGLTICILQPDAGQATAIGFSACTLLLLGVAGSHLYRFAGMGALVTMVLIAWRRPDSLPAVLEVERILHLVFGLGVIGGFAFLFSLLCLLAPILWIALGPARKGNDDRVLAMAFAVYVITTFGVTELGNFPVPIIGGGASAILGVYSILGFVAVRHLFLRE
jgi:hypothetical protein